jgi:hypothetical protein
MHLSLFRRPSCQPLELKPGELYRRPRADHVAETATVLALCPDLVGIPHVRFNVTFDRPESGHFEGGLRMLAVPSFIETYRERIL